MYPQAVKIKSNSLLFLHTTPSSHPSAWINKPQESQPTKKIRWIISIKPRVYKLPNPQHLKPQDIDATWNMFASGEGREQLRIHIGSRNIDPTRASSKTQLVVEDSKMLLDKAV